MDEFTIYLWMVGIHSFFALLATINICTCPLRTMSQRAWLLLVSWVIPFIGSVIILFRTDNELPYKSALKSNVNSNSSEYVSVEMSDSSNE